MAKSQLPDLLGDVVTAAQVLLGCRLIRDIDGQQLIGRIVETEAYHQSDAASHSYRGQTPRTEVMFGPAGRAYVYFTYGMHYCMNVVTGPLGEGSAVLIRAIEPLAAIELMRANRAGRRDHELTNGPAKLCYALKINKLLNGHDLSQPPLRLVPGEAVRQQDIIQTTRIGISEAKDKPWRFYLKNNPFVSVKSS
jgi:DNA-3-methyladenine glycosylase